MQIRGYEVGKLIGESAMARIYLTEKDNTTAIMKVAKTFDDGAELSSEAGWFNILRAQSEQFSILEKEEGVKSAGFHLLFARLVASFMEPSQDDRRINIFEFPETGTDQLTPMSKLCADVEIDSRTSVWILGRLFKFYNFCELIADSGDNPVITYPLFSPDDYFIGPEWHRVIYCNYSGKMTDLAAFDYVKAITQYMLEWLAQSEEEKDLRYRGLLEDFAKNGRVEFSQAHRDLYVLVKELWGIKYYPFTCRARGSFVWQQIEEV